MKPLTIEHLKSLEVGDWVWVVSPMYMRGRYLQVHYNGVNTIQWYGIPNDTLYMYDDYGTKWIAYKNKEMAESKGEIIELPCIVGTDCYVVKKGVIRRMTLTSYKVVTGNFVEVYFSNPKCYITEGHPDIEAERDCSMLGLFGKEWFTDIKEAERRLAELKGEKHET